MEQTPLREYQRVGVWRVKKALVDGRRPVFQMPTGSGKTVCAEALVRWALAARARALFVVNRVSLVAQTVQRFRDAGLDPGILQADNTMRVGNPLLVASIQTAAARDAMRQYLISTDLVIVDECHAVPGSKQYVAFLAETPGRVCGLTATPWSKGLGKHFNELIIGASIPQLIEQGFLVDVDAFVPETQPDLSAVQIVAGDYHETQLAQTMNTAPLVGGIVHHWLNLAHSKQTLLFAVDIAHSQAICAQFKASGVNAEHVDAYTSLEDRLAVFKRFAAGETKVITNCAVLAEGVDLPIAECMILARPTRSLIRYIQMAGRILRPYPGKEKSLILDHSRTVLELGMPTEEYNFPLDDGKARTSNPREKKEKKDQGITNCSACGFIKAVGEYRCTNCGFAPQKKHEVEYADGSLVLLQGKTRAADVKKIRHVYRQLLGYAELRNKKRGMAYFKTLEFFENHPLVAQTLRHSHNASPLPPSEELSRWMTAQTIRWVKRRSHGHQQGRLAGEPPAAHDGTVGEPPDRDGGGSQVAD